jgi:cell wall-associated NlpC family hydrolase
MRNWNDYLQIPYQARGRDWTGADCYGLVRLVLLDMGGAVMPLLPGMDDNGVAGDLELLAIQWHHIDFEDARLLDVVKIRTLAADGGPADTHVGIVAPRDMLLHSEASYGGPHMTPLSQIRRRIRGIYRHPGLA